MSLLKAIFNRAAPALTPEQQLALDTALLDAAQFNNVEKIKELLDKGANINARAPNTEDTPLIIASREDDLADVVNFLLDQKPDLTPVNSIGQTALHVILREHNSAACAIRMINADAPLNGRDMHGATPAFWAAQDGRTDVMEALIAKDADLTIPNNAGELPLMHATKLPHPATVAVMLKANAGIDVPDEEGMTGLMWSILLHKPKQAMLYIEAGCNIMMQNKAGENALDLAKKEGLDEVATALRLKMAENMAPILEGVKIKPIKTVRFAAKPPTSLR